RFRLGGSGGPAGMSEFVFKFGKHQGSYISDVPQDYLEWLVKDADEKLVVYQAELDRRPRLQEDQMPVVEEGIQAGHRALAVKYHQDKGGDPEDFRALQAANDQLRAALKAVR